jgi:hypothetical protein
VAATQLAKSQKLFQSVFHSGLAEVAVSESLNVVEVKYLCLNPQLANKDEVRNPRLLQYLDCRLA